jgi:hypothetical protein
MRLTNIAQMVLPHGRVHSYTVAVVGSPGRLLPVSFDQSRHVGEGDRPGSWMALGCRLPDGTTREQLAAAWDVVATRHGTLRTVFTPSAEGPVLNETTIAPGQWTEHQVPEHTPTRDVVRSVFDEFCRPYGQPSHRLCVVEPDAGASDRRLALVIASDHSHVDMWSLLVLLRDLAAQLEGAEPEPEAASFAEHTALLAAQAEAPESVRERWKEVMDAGAGRMPVFPLPLGDVSAARHEVVEVRDVLDSDALAHLTAHAESSGVRLIALAVGVLTTISLQTTGAPLRAVFPVHSRNDARWHDAVGWFITNAVLECADPADATAAVKEAIALGSYPLAPILAPYGGMPATPGMFALSWLDTRRLPVQIDPSFEVQYVSAVVPTDGVMIWFIVNDAGVHLRCRYPDTPEARLNVGGWLDQVQEALQSAATPAAADSL